MHARQPYAVDAHRELVPHRGYEEGLAEGLARLITRDKAGMHPAVYGFDFYVAAYQVVADVLDIHVETLWRRLWLSRVGRVRADFVDVVDEIRRTQTGRSLPIGSRGRLQAVGDRLFRSDRSNDRPDLDMLSRLWKAVLE